MKHIFVTAALLASTSVLAHETCDADIHGGVSINQNAIEFSQQGKTQYAIFDDQALYVNGSEVTLNNHQQALVTQYSKDIKALVPKAKNVALEGLDLAVDGVNLAFNELLGEGNDLGFTLTESLKEIRGEIDSNLSLEKGMYVDENGFDGETVLGEAFEARIESVLEDAIQNSIGSLMIAIGQEILFSGGDMEALETRMETFGQQIEHEIESRAHALEQRAEALCSSLAVIDDQEEQLRQEIPELADMNMITVKYNAHDKI